MNTTLLHKNLMALTGLFLVVFLIVHLAGNVQLLLPDEEAPARFNGYSGFMSSNPLVKTLSFLLYASIIAHVLMSLVITVQNRKAATTGGRYVVDRRRVASPWYSRYMGILGSIILLFLVIHVKDFWYQYKFSSLPLDGEGNKDLYAIVVQAFGQPWYIALYVVSFIALGFHLLHGFTSAFKTLGAYPPRLLRLIYFVGVGLTLLLTAGFIIIPIIVFLNHHT